jgi:hypothetical protein
VGAERNPTFGNALNQGCLLNINNCQKYSTDEIIQEITWSIIYKAKKWKIPVGKLEITDNLQNIEDTSQLWQKSPS